MAKDETKAPRGRGPAGDRLARATHELAAARAEYQEQTGESPYGLLNLHPAPVGEVVERAREILAGARKEHADPGEVDPAGYEPVLARHIAAALEGVDAEAAEARRRGDGLAHDLAQARADLQDQVDENEQVRVQLERAEATDEEQGDAEDTITVAKETRQIVREIQDEARRRAGHGCPPPDDPGWEGTAHELQKNLDFCRGENAELRAEALRRKIADAEKVEEIGDPALPDNFPYAPGPRPEIPGTERILAGLPASPDWPKIAVAEDSAFLRGGRAPYEKPTVVPWEVRFAELVGERVTLRDRVDELLASNSLEVQKRRAAEVLASERLELLEIARRQAEKNAATAVGLFDDQYAILSRYRAALMACRDYSGPVDQIVREALEGEA